MAQQQILSVGDTQPALNITQAIDEEQRQRPSAVMPENVAYSTLQLRYQAFHQGFMNSELEQCLHSDLKRAS